MFAARSTAIWQALWWVSTRPSPAATPDFALLGRLREVIDGQPATESELRTLWEQAEAWGRALQGQIEEVGYPLRCPSLQLLPLDGLSGAAEHLGQRLRLGLHRLLEEAIEEQAAVVRTAPVEAEGELIEVVVELLRADGALVGAE
jgi:hypothetical protein